MSVLKYIKSLKGKTSKTAINLTSKKNLSLVGFDPNPHEPLKIFPISIPIQPELKRPCFRVDLYLSVDATVGSQLQELCTKKLDLEITDIQDTKPNKNIHLICTLPETSITPEK